MPEVERANTPEELRRRIWGFDAFKPGQRQAIDTLIGGGDVVVLLPTGGGKSLCYQLPALAMGCTVVVSPLIALMQDQVKRLEHLGIRAGALHSQQDLLANRETAAHFVTGKLDLLYVSPERAALAGFKRLAGRAPVALLAIDEAHCISQWGHDFRFEYLRLGELKRLLAVPTIALTATATPRVMAEIVSYLALDEPAIIRGSFSRPNLRFGVRPVSTDRERLALLTSTLDRLELGRTAQAGRAIIYCATRKKVESVAAALGGVGLAVAHYHAGRSDNARRRAHESYHTGRRPVLVATNAFGMGIDHPDVRAIIHFQTPGSVEAYYQEAGRAGRDDAPALCDLYFGRSDLVTQRLLGARRGRTRAGQREALLCGIEHYATTQICRQQQIHRYFTAPDDNHLSSAPPCGQCDVCQSPGAVAEAFAAFAARRQRRTPVSPTPLVPEEIDTIVAAVGALSRPVGKTALAKALRGSRAKSLKRGGLLTVPQHGALAAHDEASLVAAIESLLDAGTLARRGNKYPTVWIPDRPLRRPRPKTARRRVSGLCRALESYRRREARRLRWKPYMVFQRKVIDAIDAERPESLWALQQIAGIGPSKTERFGADLLELVRQFS